MKILAAVLLTATLSTSALSWKGADGYQFEGKQYDKSSMVIRKVEYPNLTALRAAAYRFGREHTETLKAFSVPMPEINVCVVHMVDPTVMDFPEFVGHEVMHCWYGDWHPEITARWSVRSK